MNQVVANWYLIKGNIKYAWGKLFQDQFTVISGILDRTSGRIQKTYGLSRDEAKVLLRLDKKYLAN
jgi:uncharacterized protein YjbJ (UPF0337 family)